MTLRDLSYWAIVKLTLFITITLPIIAIILVLPIALLDLLPVSFNVTSDKLPKLFGTVGFEMKGIPNWTIALFVIPINLLASSKALQLIARFTPIGRIKIEKAAPKSKAPNLSSWREIT